MEELSSKVYCQRAALELVQLVAHQRRPRGRERRDSSLLKLCMQRVLSDAAPLEELQDGPWRVSTRALKRPGRGGLRFIPLAVRGRTEIMLPTPRDAEELVAFLNVCGLPEFGTR